MIYFGSEKESYSFRMKTGAKPKPAKILVGTASWSDPGFVEHWYPKKMPAGERLAWYAQHFEMVEVNSTFYSAPEPRMVERWCRSTPGGNRQARLTNRPALLTGVSSAKSPATIAGAARRACLHRARFRLRHEFVRSSPSRFATSASLCLSRRSRPISAKRAATISGSWNAAKATGGASRRRENRPACSGTTAPPFAPPAPNRRSSLPRPSRNAARTRPAAPPPAFSSDTNARRNRDPTNWPCRPEFLPASLWLLISFEKDTILFHPESKSSRRAFGVAFGVRCCIISLKTRGGAAW